MMPQKYRLVSGICSITDMNQYRQDCIDINTGIGIGASLLYTLMITA